MRLELSGLTDAQLQWIAWGLGLHGQRTRAELEAAITRWPARQP